MSPNKTSPLLSSCLLAITLSLLHGVITTPAAASYFTEPEAPFIISSSETIQVVPLPAGSVDSAQTIIDAARSNNPASVLLLQPAGKLEVGNTPLQLGGNMCLQLSPEACIAASGLLRTQPDLHHQCHECLHLLHGTRNRPH